MKVEFLAPNQAYIKTDEKIIFQSYQTVVCEITNGNEPIIKITEGQPQSKTTAKYLNQFLKLTVGIDNYKNL
jgi:hypothetical protein